MSPKAYLDTCIISGLAKEDLKKSEQKALNKLLQLHKKREIQLVTSAVTEQELQKIPAKVRNRHEMIYRLLLDVPMSSYKKTDSGLTLMGVGGGTKVDPIYLVLKDILKDENDIHHVFQAIKNGCEYFVTTDRKTILKHSTKLFVKFKEFMVLSPHEIIKLLSVTI